MGAQLQVCGRICWRETRVRAGKKAVSSDSQPAFFRNEAKAWAPSPFPDFGGAAPICPQPPQKPISGPITLDVLQGEWYGGNGSSIVVLGTGVSLNGLPLRGHKVELHEDGTLKGIGQIWQLEGWGTNGAVEFRASSTPENMEFAPKEVWTRKDAAAPWAERMQLLGYAGTASDPLNRGIEGCIPGTLAQDMPSSNDAQDVELLQTLIFQWREQELHSVHPRRVVPDFINRENTGVGVELVHYIAISMQEQGFKKRRGNAGHDIPVVVREPPASVFHGEALRAWKEKVAEEEGFPPVRISAEEELFTSLGNGHFFQALNLLECACPRINGKGKYVVGEDADLAEAISLGVPSLVLTSATPRPVRAKIAQLLNAKREFRWSLSEDGIVDTAMKEDIAYCKQFECMSKFLDAVQVNSLVRTHLGIRDSNRT